MNSDEEKIERRRRRVQELKRKSYTQKEIAAKLKVSEQTISADMQVINTRYRALITNNEGYLLRTAERMFEWLDKYDFVVKQLYDLKDGSAKIDKTVEGLVDRYQPKIEYTEEEMKLDQVKRKRYCDREGQRNVLRSTLCTIAKANVVNHTNILREIRTTLTEQAKVLQLITGNKTYVQNNTNYIYAEQLQVVFETVDQIIKTYVPEDRRIDALKLLKQIDFKPSE